MSHFPLPASRTLLRAIGCTACAALLAVSLCLLPSCGKSSSSEVSSSGIPGADSYVSPYDFNGLVRTDGRLTYSVNGSVVSKLGIDVSEHQGTIDWNAVAADGIDFAIIRVGNRGTTEGGLSTDAQFENNLAGAQAAGLECGVYFFSQAVNEDEAREEADFVLAQLGTTSLDYPIVFDEEVVGTQGRASGLSKSQLTANAQAFCERIEQAGYRTMIYGNAQDVAKLDVSALSSYPFWYAEYGEKTPSGRFDFTIWQYSNSGTVAGIDAAVDMDIDFMGNGGAGV